MSGPLPVARVPRPQMPEAYDQATIEAAFQALERDLVARFTRKADLALEPGKRLVLAGSGGNTQYALGLTDDGLLTVTNYLTGAEGELIIDWAAIDGAAERDLQITTLEAAAAGIPGTYATISSLNAVESSLNGSIASLSSSVSAAFASTNASVSSNASAITTVQGAAAYYTVEVAATGSDPALVTLRAGASGSEIGLIARILRLKNIVGTTTVEVMRAVGGLVFFSNPISMDFAGRRLTIGPGFGVSGQEVILWFGPDSTAPSAQSRTNGNFAFGSNGVPYFGAAALSWGATAAEAAASNALVGLGVNALSNTDFRNGTYGWLAGWDAGQTITRGLNFGTGTGAQWGGKNVMYAFVSGTPAANAVFDLFAQGCYFIGFTVEHMRRYAMAVVPGERLYCSWGIATLRLTRAEIYVRFHDAGGNNPQEVLVTSGTGVVGEPIGGDAGDFSRLGDFLIVPSGAAFAGTFVRGVANGSASPNLYGIEPFLARVAASQTSAPPYSSGVSDTFADYTRDSPVTQYLSDVGTIDDWQGLPTNVSAGAGSAVSVRVFNFPAVSQISIAAHTRYLAGQTYSFPSGTITGLSNSTEYYVFRDIVANSYIATSNFTTATGYITDTARRYLFLGSYTTTDGGGGGGGSGWNGAGVEP